MELNIRISIKKYDQDHGEVTLHHGAMPSTIYPYGPEDENTLDGALEDALDHIKRISKNLATN